MSHRPIRAAACFASAIALMAGGIAATTSAAQAVVDPSCPDAYPTANLTPGQPVTGLTTVRGTTPEEFHGTYVGTIHSGIGPGYDLPVFELEGSRITHADGTPDAGIWAGMSGSPVYDDATGDLIGAVSYGFSGDASKRAGVTPASYMYGLADPKYSAPSVLRGSVKASRSEASAIVRNSEDPTPLGTGHVLKPSKQVSGISAARANSAAAKSRLLQQKAPFKSGGFRAGGSDNGGGIDYPIVPGGNIAATLSTGDVTTGSVGTVTAVCGDQVFAFGHPDEFTGRSTETFSGASAVDVQEDGSPFGSYKIANIGAVKGVINQDRLTGILGTLGQTPSTAAVTTHATGLGDTRDATSQVSVQAALPYVVAGQVSNDAIALLNQYSSGDALMSWTVTYRRSGASGTQTFGRTQRYSTDSGFPDTVAFAAASDVESLLSNGFEKVTISSVAVTAAYQPEYRAYELYGAQYKSGSTWKSLAKRGTVTVKPGARVPLRLKLRPALGSDVPARTVELNWQTSRHSTGIAPLTFTGQAAPPQQEFFGFDEGDGEDPIGSLDELLDLLAQPRADSVLGALLYRTTYGQSVSTRTIHTPGLTGGSFPIRIAFKK